MSIEIRLTHTPYSVSLTRDQLQTLNGSLLTQAIGSDTEVIIDNPLVTPTYLNLLAMMARQEEIKALPPDKDLHKASVYLNWPLLSVIQNPKYIQMQSFAPYCNLYRPETFGSVLPWAIANNFPMLTHHILQMTELNALDNQGLAVSVMYGRTRTTKILLTRGCDPSVMIDASILVAWSGFSRRDNWSILTGTRSGYEDAIDEVKSYPIVWMAIWRCLEGWKGNRKLFRMLFQHPALHGELPKEIYRDAFMGRDNEEKRNVFMAKILLAQTQFNFTRTYRTTNYTNGGMVRRKATLLGELAFGYRNRKVFKVLAEDPRCPISESLRKEIIGYCKSQDGQYPTQIDEIQGELLSTGQWQYLDPSAELELLA
jgi:hypothetical protein